MKFLLCFSFVFLTYTIYSQSHFIEAETATAVGTWKVQKEHKGFKGSGYFTYPGPKNKNPKQGLKYEFNIEKEGTYWLQIRCRRDKDNGCGAGAASDECNDFFTKVNGGKWEKTMAKKATYGDDDGGGGSWANWFWDGRISGRKKEHGGSGDQRAIHELKVGKNTLVIGGRSPGVKIDAIAIFPFSEKRPLPNSNTSSISGNFQNLASNPISLGKDVNRQALRNIRGAKVNRTMQRSFIVIKK